MSPTPFLHSTSRHQVVRRLGLPLASTAAVIALTGYAAPAKALSFDWQFQTYTGLPLDVQGGYVKGTISGLLDNASGQTSGLTLNVTSAPNTPTGGWLNDWYYNYGPGFTVSNGQVGGYAALKNSLSDQLILGDGNNYGDQLGDANNTIYNLGYLGVTYTPSTSPVPGPLPILGAASALGWRRKVRRRLRSAQRSAS